MRIRKLSPYIEVITFSVLISASIKWVGTYSGLFLAFVAGTMLLDMIDRILEWCYKETREDENKALD